METSLLMKDAMPGGGGSGRCATRRYSGPEPLCCGFEAALQMTLKTIRPLSAETLPLVESVGRMVGTDLFSLVNSPAMDSSRKDGFAVACADIAGATKEAPVSLTISGNLAAGEKSDIPLCAGATVRVLTGARTPIGADAVVAEEYVVRKGDTVFFDTPIQPG